MPQNRENADEISAGLEDLPSPNCRNEAIGSPALIWRMLRQSLLFRFNKDKI
ncbi:MAG: hypothetical protein HC887_12485 [Desulfobacteraceae bacterium]|nr:hypothetical protein [Desulfobacteraceae bacterium]